MTSTALPDMPVAYEFFAGGGLAGLGLEGFRIAFANDLDEMKAAAFRTNHPRTPFRRADVWDLTLADLPGRPDLVWASSPCQDLSLAGTRGGLKSERSGAFWGFWRLVQQLQADGRSPRAVVLENVSGLLTSSGGADLAAVCKAMAEAGYRVGALEMDAAWWLPQSRPRLFVVGLKGAEHLVEHAPVAPFHTPRLIRAQAGLPQSVQEAWAWWSVAAPAQRNADLDSLLSADAEWMAPAETEALLSLLSPLHRARLEAIQASGERRIGAGFRRVRREGNDKRQRLELRFDGLAGCLRTPSGGSSRQYVVEVEGARVRARRLTGREAARLMGLPDDYRLPDRDNAALKLTGDAVAVPVVRALSDQLLLPALTNKDEALKPRATASRA
ncbi:DNA cytosine methyltransferase [Brevundimonas sp. S30B]|uniref:DNA cytosine methyltransferase n=1 Tax=unclassified Brevundimonas TaxID=2622653 RepID=UPI001071A56E|nr:MULTISPECIES: DNA cytosine methyltransferase [unclassified Brevundimonas]QBX37065.1 DNA cytosine methyltransferase [Brevundimonas sp. MF30-B]TFW04139.1 DNA cytosine methyltransferase [Brevundimonas sp. S30B]